MVFFSPFNFFYCMSQTSFILQEESYNVIGACMEVHRVLGHGFSEAVYKEALEIEFRLRGIPFEREKRFEILYKDQRIARYFIADFVVYGQIILEVKCISNFEKEHSAQVLNYLKCSKSPVGLLVNFSRNSLEQKRLILS